VTLRRAGLRTALAGLLALALLVAPAHASQTQESILMDDSLFVYAQPDKLDARFAEAKALGFDRIRVSVYWRLLAPQPNQKQRPQSQYPMSDPRFYTQSGWDRYDRIVALASKHGLGVLFTLTGPAPLWVTGTPEGGRSDVEDTWNPDAAAFKDFATAAGTRYSGKYRDEHEQPALIPLLPPSRTEGPVLGRVDHWSIWNEPNHGGWLTPQWHAPPGGRKLVPVSPGIYRGLVDAAWSGLQASGHGGDTILLGETAPRGLHRPGLTRGVRPLRFIRDLYCVDGKFHPYSGAGARQHGCPESPDPAAFAQAHPGLFAAPGWAHHPYSLTTAPWVADANRDDATLSGLRRLTRTLDRTFAAYGQSARLPIWLTEYGYQTDPPDPTIGLAWSRQADWLDDATFRAFRNPHVVSMAQFLLVDDGPIKEYKPDDPRYWGTFQTGLVTEQGKRKTAYDSFQHPIAVSPRRLRAGRRVRVFGQLRIAADGARLAAQVQFRPRGSRSWKKVASVTVANPRGFVERLVRMRRSGSFRIAWQGGPVTRAVHVRVGRRR
jgi:hypothetical protein